MDIVEKNNQLVEQDNRYRRVVHRILKELSELVRESINEVELIVDGIAYFDSIYARARYSQLHRCVRAARSERRIMLHGARHPLLGKGAIPIDFELGENADIMVITGANAGGKTVTLKTVGILALMNQWGMEIPAHEGCEFPIFDNVLVDIGDDQSIANSLSTFSGHMKALSTIIAECTASSLVLLDEIGSGTDPTEGSALAMAVLDYLDEKECLVVATTHHGIIKRYGYSRARITNASVSFDSATLSPTYELVIGVPGESHALEIASRSRIPSEVIAHAREYVEAERTDLDRAIDEIAAHRRELDDQSAQLERLQHELAGRDESLREREAKLDETQEALHSQEHGELGDFLRESRRMLENLVRELRTGEITREKTHKVKGFIDKIEEKLADEERKPAARPAGLSEEAIEEGCEVYVGKNRRRGTVLRRLRGDNWLVAVNTLKMTIPTSDLIPAARKALAPDVGQGVSVMVAGSAVSESPAFELDLRGMRLEEALESLERQLDRALLSGMAEFSVIHGKGEGVLRQGVQRVLKASNAVSEFFFSPPETGGFGKTIVKLGK
jgi:DNA mismatch repair protein MutS2